MPSPDEYLSGVPYLGGGDNGSIGFGSVLVRDFLMTH